ncbi:SusC/RagA family TonB-linked outer membrane protein [uncultured Sanguibacteroides sp.]|uniref:SusC/RagA family TonB-linked outer membrane protein n=1 Tax=uncultured Sanguibacteroides sp. TaxID=1635151 RepID=UPI0025EB12AA|nr:SusC/RagA family TonB-linked outer membrane protein [uncultured Sanguibacteroides sp.]
MKKKCKSKGFAFKAKPRKLLLIMKFLCLFFLISTQISAMSYSQETRLTFDFKDISLVDILSAIRKNSEFSFIYNLDDVRNIRVKSLHVKEASVEDVLNLSLRNTGFRYSIEDKVIVIRPEDKKVKKCKYTGTVKDKKGETMPGVTVRVDSTTIGVSTDINGMFSMQLTQDSVHLIFSFVGYKTKKVKCKADKPVTVVLEEDVSDLDEVTVIAYGERKKREMVGAVSSVKAKDLEEIPSSSFENLLQGHMAGVEITNVTGAPGGGGTRVNIRGYNSLLIDKINDGSPLYVIDGVPVNSFTSPVTGTNTLAEIDPSTIASVEVLKDAASAAIYGSRASNGVILITTKQGKAGEGKFSVNLSYSYSILPETPVQIGGNGERKWHLLTARKYRYGFRAFDPVTMTWATKFPTSYYDVYGQGDGAYDYFWNNGRVTDTEGNTFPVVRPLQDSLNPFFNNCTNWWKYTFRAGKILNANIQTSGGTERIRYMVGAGWYDEKGIMIGSNFKRANLISNLNITPRKNLNIDARLSLSYADRSKGRANTSFGSARKIEGLTINPSGTSTLLPGDGEIQQKLLEELNESLEKNISFTVRASLGLSYEIVKGLVAKASLSGDYSYNKKNAFTPSILDSEDGLSISAGEMSGDMLLQNEDLLTYNFTLNNNHHFDLLAGFSYMRKSVDYMSGHGKGAPSDKIHYVPVGFDDIKYINGVPVPLKDYVSNFEEQIMLGIFGRIAYNYRQKYLFEATLRRDGSSTFGEKVRWATFPSVAVGWAFSEENAFKDLWWLSYGKLRFSWGTSGQAFADSYLAHGTLGIGSSFLGRPGMVPTSLLNDRLTWEETDQYNIGFDFDVLDYRLKFKFDYYYKYSKSLLFDALLPGNVYFHETAWKNAMAISNEGLELEAYFDILRESAVSWRARFNISRNWNRLEKTYTNMDIHSKGTHYVLGRPISGFYVYKAYDLAQTEADIPKYWNQNGVNIPLNSGGEESPFRPGMVLLADLNGDGEITGDDTYYAGSALPVAYGGLANEIKWKGFDLNVLFTYTLGRKIINSLKHGSLAFNGRWGTIYNDYRKLHFWQKPGDMGMPTLEAASDLYSGQFSGATDKMIEKVSWVRLKQLTLGYNVPKNLLKKINMEGVRVFFTAENLFILSNYSGIDPEAVDQMMAYDNLNNYPLSRKLTLGLTINF